jgi:hypothetical protein
MTLRSMNPSMQTPRRNLFEIFRRGIQPIRLRHMSSSRSPGTSTWIRRQRVRLASDADLDMNRGRVQEHGVVIGVSIFIYMITSFDKYVTSMVRWLKYVEGIRIHCIHPGKIQGLHGFE